MSERTPQEAVIEAVKTSRDDLNAIRCSRTCGHASCVAAARIVLAVDALIASEQPWKMVDDCCLRGPDGIEVEVSAPMNHPFGATGPVKAATARVCSLLNRASRASVARERSSFAVWFEAQYGPAPGAPLRWSGLSEKVRILQSQLDRAEEVLRDRQLWEARHDAALKEWQARERSDG